MNINRRQFIKLAGFSAALGLGGATVFKGLGTKELEAATVSKGPNALLGKHWGMVVDITKLRTEEDYQKCIGACHNAHNVPDFGNPKDEIKWIWKEDYEHSFPNTEHPYMVESIKEKPFLLLCNHCENPPCVRVCPTKATFKRPSDGIVMQDMHRCIGCRFCMAACPFGARSFNWRDPRPFIKKENLEYPTRTKGVVEKCTFCFERLAKGLQPACVEAVKETKALVFGDLEDADSEVREVLRTSYSIRRKPELGTAPSVYYVIGLIGGKENA
jgi:molybdopterin-containing oxidoreductase family iron-sulfur binding subunit